MSERPATEMQAVGPFSVVERREDAETDRGRHDEKEREAAENERVVEPVEGDRRDRTVQQEGGSPVAAHEAAEPGRVALEERAIDAELMVERPHLHFGRVGAEDGAPDIARHHLGDQEQDDRDAKERDEGQGKTLDEEPTHAARSSRYVLAEALLTTRARSPADR